MQNKGQSSRPSPPPPTPGVPRFGLGPAPHHPAALPCPAERSCDCRLSQAKRDGCPSSRICTDGPIAKLNKQTISKSTPNRKMQPELHAGTLSPGSSSLQQTLHKRCTTYACRASDVGLGMPNSDLRQKQRATVLNRWGGAEPGHPRS